LSLNGSNNVIDIGRYLARPNLADGLNREELAALLEQVKALEGRVMARLLLGATEQPAVTRAPEDDGPMLTVDEAASRLHRDRRWIYRHAKSLPFVKRLSPRNLLCSERKLNRWLEQRKA
jgi:hypothetical protein